LSRQGPLAFGERVYAAVMGIGSERLAQPTGQPGVSAGLADIIYYSYKKGFWPLLRGLLYRPRLRSSQGRFFLGRGTRILFPSHLAVGKNVAIGDYVYMNCFGRTGVTLGNNVRIREFGSVLVTSHLSHPGEGITVGDGTYIGPHAVLGAGGGLSIGKDVTCGAYVQLLAENHNFKDPDLPIAAQGVNRKGITVEDGCWLGNSVIVLDGVTLGAHSVIGAASVVTRDIPPGSVAVGNPARVIKERAAL
jgi:acetyltransferase-like isoleucine patch superfamily enzyme